MKKTIVMAVLALLLVGSASAALTDNLVSYWGGNNATYEDPISGNDGTITGTTYNATGGIVGGAHMWVASESDQITIPITPSDLGANNFTWQYWLYVTDKTRTANAIMFESAGSGFPRFTAWGGTEIIDYYMSAADYLVTADNALLSDTWQHVIVTRGDDNFTLWVDGTRIEEEIYSVTFSSSNNFELGAWDGETPADRWLDGRLDEVAYWSRQLSNTEIGELHNGGAGLAYPFTGGSLIVTNAGPPNNFHSNLNPQTNLTFNVDNSVDGAGANCTLWLDEGGGYFKHSNATLFQVSNGTGKSVPGNIYLNESSQDWKVECNTADLQNRDNSTAFTIIQDYTNPVNNLFGDVAADNSTVRNRWLQNESVDVDIKAEDANLWGFNVTVTGSVYGEIYTNQTTGLGGTVFESNNTLNLSSICGGQCVPQEFTIAVNSSDDHTKRAIPDYQTTFVKSKITFKPGNDNNIKIETTDPADGSALKQTDRYKFFFYFDDNATATRTFRVKTDLCPLEYRGDSPYQAHFVSSCGIGGNWIDFEGAGENPVVEKIDDYDYRVTLDNVPPTAEFSSVGGLNWAYDEWRFNWSLFTVSPTTTTDGIATTWIMSNWTNTTGSNLYGVYRDGVNVANTTNDYYNHSSLASGTDFVLGVTGIYNDSETYYENFTLNTVNAQTIFNGSLSIEIRNEVTNDALSGFPVFINLLGSVANVTGNTSTGSISLANITSDNYTVRHSANGWGSRDQYLEIGENDSGSIILYLINDTVRDPGRVFVANTKGDPVNGAIAKLSRYFPDESLYRVVQMATTNTDGRAVFDAEAYDAFYKWTVEMGGVTQVLTTIPEFLSIDQTTQLWIKSFTINDGTDYWTSWLSSTNDDHAVTYNNATRTLTYTYNDPDSIITTACIEARWANGTHWQTEGPNCLSAATGSINLLLPNVNKTFTYTAYYHTNTKFSKAVAETGTVDYLLEFWKNNPEQRNAAVFMGLMLQVGVAGLFAFNAVLGSLAVVMSLVVFAALPIINIFPFSVHFVIGIATIVIGYMLFGMRRT